MPVMLLPTTELVAIAWLKGVSGIPANSVATRLPADISTWTDTGFVQCQAITGATAPDKDSPLNNPVVQVDTWWCAPSPSKQPPWNKANNLMELVRAGTYTENMLRTVSLPSGYPSARVLSVYLVTEPRRMNDDDSSYARFSADMKIHWVTLV